MRLCTKYEVLNFTLSSKRNDSHNFRMGHATLQLQSWLTGGNFSIHMQALYIVNLATDLKYIALCLQKI